MSSVEIEKIGALAQSHQPKLQRLFSEVKKILVGQDDMLLKLTVALLCRAHVLLEGVPGLAKTLTINTLALASGCKFNRISFTPDLLPADIIGTRIYNPATNEFLIKKGPVFCNLLLAMKSTGHQPRFSQLF
jgi:MoxR-like ATPase